LRKKSKGKNQKGAKNFIWGFRGRPTSDSEVKAELGLIFEQTSAEVSEVLVKDKKTEVFQKSECILTSFFSFHNGNVKPFLFQ